MLEYGLRFLAGGSAVSAFVALGDTLRPKSFAGLFGAAPSIALATLLITLSHWPVLLLRDSQLPPICPCRVSSRAGAVGPAYAGMTRPICLEAMRCQSMLRQVELLSAAASRVDPGEWFAEEDIRVHQPYLARRTLDCCCR